MSTAASSSALTFVSGCSLSSAFLQPRKQRFRVRSVHYHHPYSRRRTASCCATSDANGNNNNNNDEPNTRLRARVAYVGTRYHGWQLQLNSDTIQGLLESVLQRRYRHLIRVVGASRTDTGVHARGQGVHFDIPSSCINGNIDNIDVGQLQHSMNRMLPPDIRVSSLGVAPASSIHPGKGYRWHAMYNSAGKYYAYRLCTRAVSDPLASPYRYHVYDKSTFSPERLRDACTLFQGTHDFASFANKSPNTSFQVTTVRTIRALSIHDDGSGHLRLDFRLDGALYRMVRNVVGAMLAVAHGTLEADDVLEIFASRDRNRAPMGAPACGLCLEHVYYNGWNQDVNEAFV